MTERNFETTKKIDNSFGGIIYPLDFDRKITLSEIASRIESDHKFDQTCKLNSANKRIETIDKEGNAAC